MRLTISGDEALQARFQSLTKVMKTTFWNYVRTDLQDNLLKNVKPHHVTGKLERNVYAKTTDDGVEAGIRTDGTEVSWNGKRVSYGVFVNYGTKPHTIEAKDKKALRWVGAGGAFAFAKSVQHPGTKASHFIERSAKTTFENLDKMFSQAMRQEGL